MFQLNNFSFKYPNSHKVFEYNGNIECNSGDRILIHGDSGSGKSTLLYALKGIIPNTILGEFSGEVLYNNQNICSLNNQQKIAIVLQNPRQQFIHKTVQEELAFNLENLQYSITEIINTISYFAKKLKIEYLLNRDIVQLSGGEAQKIAIMSVLMMKPQVLLMDEPTAFLDEDSIFELLSLIDNLDFNPAIIIVEHNYQYFKNIINKTIYINDNGGYIISTMYPISYDYNKINLNYIDKVILSIDNLTFSYNKTYLLQNFSLKLYQQQIIGIKGRSGCGKSTLLRIIAGMVKNYQGDIMINHKNLKQYKNFALYHILGLLFQNPENHFLTNKVIDEVANFDSLVAFNLQEVAKQNPFTLSEGQKRRLSILALNKYIETRMIYLLDEPTFGQDYQNINQLITMINKLKIDGASFIIVSHDNNFLTSICDQIIEL